MIHEFKGHKFHFNDTRDAPGLLKEIFSDNYQVLKKDIKFKEGDVILDLGANEGFFSIMMAKLYPQTRVIAVEPIPRTYFQLLRNIGLNGTTNVEPVNLGVGKPGMETLNVSKDFSGGSTALCEYNPDHHDRTEVVVVSLDQLFASQKIEHCRLLKFDVEGMEYDTFYPSTVLPKVDCIAGEVHMNRRLDFMGRRMDALVTWIGNQTEFIHVEFCRMAE